MIRKGRAEDLCRIEEIYERILVQQDLGKVSVGWIRGIYPTRKTAEDSLKAGDLFVLEDEGVVVAAAKINQQQVPEYRDARWEKPAAPDDQIMVLHTLVVDPVCAGKGYGSEFVRYYEEYALEHGCLYLRMDTNAVNITARRLYNHLGYSEADIVSCIFNGIPDVRLVCLEKTLRKVKK